MMHYMQQKQLLEEGIVTRRWSSIIICFSGIEADSIGANIVKTACSKPFNQILVNAGYDEVKGQILADSLINSGNDVWAGVDVESGRYC